MPLQVDGVDVISVQLDGVDIDSLELDGVEVWSRLPKSAQNDKENTDGD